MTTRVAQNSEFKLQYSCHFKISQQKLFWVLFYDESYGMVVWFNHAFLRLESRNTTKQQEEIQ